MWSLDIELNVGHCGNSHFTAVIVDIDTAMAKAAHHLNTDQSVDVEEEEVEQSHKEQLLPPKEGGAGRRNIYQGPRFPAKISPSLDVSEQLLDGEGELDVDKELDGGEYGQAPQHHGDIEVGVNVTPVLPLSDATGYLVGQSTGKGTQQHLD